MQRSADRLVMGTLGMASRTSSTALARRSLGALVLKRHYLLPVGDVKFIATEERGKFDTPKWRFCYSCRGRPISPWHSIPLFTDPHERKICHFVLEMPRGTSDKLGVNQKEEWNNLKHDVKEGKLVTITQESSLGTTAPCLRLGVTPATCTGRPDAQVTMDFWIALKSERRHPRGEPS